MFRPTHFVILFAVVLCASAVPAPQITREGPARTPEIGESQSPSAKLPVSGSEGEDGADKGDLKTDATTYWRYTYYGPRWGYTPIVSEKLAGWGFGFGKLYPTEVVHYVY